jgi:hypothetical protein
MSTKIMCSSRSCSDDATKPSSSFHSGIFGHYYIYYRNDNDDDEELCRPCAIGLSKLNGYLGSTYNSQFRMYEGSGSGECNRCHTNPVDAYWTCCFSTDSNSISCKEEKTNSETK